MENNQNSRANIIKILKNKSKLLGNNTNTNSKTTKAIANRKNYNSRYKSRYNNKTSPRTRSTTRNNNQTEKPNFFLVKLVIAAIIFLTVVFTDKFNIKIGNFTSEKIFDVLYYNEDISKENNVFTKINVDTIVEAWNNLK